MELILLRMNPAIEPCWCIRCDAPFNRKSLFGFSRSNVKMFAKLLSLKNLCPMANTKDQLNANATAAST
jgi:hypothetical protein